MDEKFNVGDKILVINMGVCSISSIDAVDNGGELKEYYILHPVFKNTSDKIMIPVGSKKNIRTLVEKETASKVLEDFKTYQNFWIKNPRDRKEYFIGLLNSGDIFTFKNLYLTLQNKKIELLANKKLLNSTDKYVLDNVIKSLSEELSIVLGLDFDEISNKLNSLNL